MYCCAEVETGVEEELRYFKEAREAIKLGVTEITASMYPLTLTKVTLKLVLNELGCLRRLII